MSESMNLWNNEENADERPPSEELFMHPKHYPNGDAEIDDDDGSDIDVVNDDVSEMSDSMSISSSDYDELGEEEEGEEEEDEEVEVLDLSPPGAPEPNQNISTQATEEDEGEIFVDVEDVGNHHYFAVPGDSIFDTFTQPMTVELMHAAAQFAYDDPMFAPSAMWYQSAQVWSATHSMPISFPLPLADVANLCRDWTNVQRYLSVSELHYDEHVRLWDLFQGILSLTARCPKPKTFDVNHPDYDEEMHRNWLLNQRYLDDFLKIAELFSQLLYTEFNQ